jgi:hypothetical protein
LLINILDDSSNNVLNHRPINLPEFDELDIKGPPYLLHIIKIRKLRHFGLIYKDAGLALLVEDIPSPKHIQSLNVEGVKITSHQNEENFFPNLSKLRLNTRDLGCLPMFNAPKLKDLTVIDNAPSKSKLSKSREIELVNSILDGDYVFSPPRLTLGRMLLDVYLPKFLQLQPDLSTLKIVDCKLSTYFLKWLANASEERPSMETLPALSTIHIIKCVYVPGETYSLEMFVRECAIGRPSVQVGIENL